MLEGFSWETVECQLTNRVVISKSYNLTSITLDRTQTHQLPHKLTESMVYYPNQVTLQRMLEEE